MKSAVLCCLVVLSLGLSAAPMPVAADVGMGSMLSVITRGLLSVDAHKKVCTAAASRGPRARASCRGYAAASDSVATHWHYAA